MRWSGGHREVLALGDGGNVLELDHLANDRCDVAFLRMQLGGTGECQEVIEQRREARDLLLREVGRLEEPRVIELAPKTPFEELELQLCRVERVAYLVRESRTHRLDRDDPLGLTA